MTHPPMDPPDLAGGATGEAVRDGVAAAYLLTVADIMEQWTTGTMDPQRALRKIRKALDRPLVVDPVMEPVVRWENNAHDFKREMTKILGRVCWKLLAVLRPPEEWPMEHRSSR